MEFSSRFPVYISSKEAAEEKLCTHCLSVMEIRQISLTEAVRQCFSCSTPFRKLDEDEIEYIHRSYEDIGKAPEDWTECFTRHEEELEKIQKWFKQQNDLLSKYLSSEDESSEDEECDDSHRKLQEQDKSFMSQSDNESELLDILNSLGPVGTLDSSQNMDLDWFDDFDSIMNNGATVNHQQSQALSDSLPDVVNEGCTTSHEEISPVTSLSLEEQSVLLELCSSLGETVSKKFSSSVPSDCSERPKQPESKAEDPPVQPSSQFQFPTLLTISTSTNDLTYNAPDACRGNGNEIESSLGGLIAEHCVNSDPKSSPAEKGTSFNMESIRQQSIPVAVLDISVPSSTYDGNADFSTKTSSSDSASVSLNAATPLHLPTIDIVEFDSRSDAAVATLAESSYQKSVFSEPLPELEDSEPPSGDSRGSSSVVSTVEVSSHQKSVFSELLPELEISEPPPRDSCGSDALTPSNESSLQKSVFSEPLLELEASDPRCSDADCHRNVIFTESSSEINTSLRLCASSKPALAQDTPSLEELATIVDSCSNETPSVKRELCLQPVELFTQLDCPEQSCGVSHLDGSYKDTEWCYETESLTKPPAAMKSAFSSDVSEHSVPPSCPDGSGVHCMSLQTALFEGNIPLNAEVSVGENSSDALPEVHTESACASDHQRTSMNAFEMCNSNKNMSSVKSAGLSENYLSDYEFAGAMIFMTSDKAYEIVPRNSAACDSPSRDPGYVLQEIGSKATNGFQYAIGTVGNQVCDSPSRDPGYLLQEIGSKATNGFQSATGTVGNQVELRDDFQLDPTTQQIDHCTLSSPLPPSLSVYGRLNVLPKYVWIPRRKASTLESVNEAKAKGTPSKLEGVTGCGSSTTPNTNTGDKNVKGNFIPITITIGSVTSTLSVPCGAGIGPSTLSTENVTDRTSDIEINSSFLTDSVSAVPTLLTKTPVTNISASAAPAVASNSDSDTLDMKTLKVVYLNSPASGPSTNLEYPAFTSTASSEKVQTYPGILPPYSADVSGGGEQKICSGAKLKPSQVGRIRDFENSSISADSLSGMSSVLTKVPVINKSSSRFTSAGVACTVSAAATKSGSDKLSMKTLKVANQNSPTRHPSSDFKYSALTTTPSSEAIRTSQKNFTYDTDDGDDELKNFSGAKFKPRAGGRSPHKDSTYCSDVNDDELKHFSGAKFQPRSGRRSGYTPNLQNRWSSKF